MRTFELMNHFNSVAASSFAALAAPVAPCVGGLKPKRHVVLMHIPPTLLMNHSGSGSAAAGRLPGGETGREMGGRTMRGVGG